MNTVGSFVLAVGLTTEEILSKAVGPNLLLVLARFSLIAGSGYLKILRLSRVMQTIKLSAIPSWSGDGCSGGGTVYLHEHKLGRSGSTLHTL